MRRNQPRQPHASANPDDSDNFSDLSDSDVQLAKRGIYYITDEIEDEGLLHIHQDILLKHLAPDWSDPIQLIINSPGGACSAGWSLIDLLEYVKMPVHTVGLGTIASMAAVLFASGTIGRRMLAPNCEIMVHLPYQELGHIGDVHDIAALNEGHRREYKRHLDFWITHSNLSTKEEVESRLLTREDRWLTSPEAIELGIADGLVGSRKTKRSSKKKIKEKEG